MDRCRRCLRLRDDVMECCVFLPAKADRRFVGRLICADCHDEIVGSAMGSDEHGCYRDPQDLDRYYEWLKNEESDKR